MKKTFSKVVLTSCSLLMTFSCSSNSGTLKSLDDQRISKFDTYSSVGYGSKKTNAAQNKKELCKPSIKQARKVFDHEKTRTLTSENQFSLVGQNDDGTIENLLVNDGKDGFDISISHYAELPGFIAFSYGNQKEGDQYTLEVTSYDDNDFMFRHRWDLHFFDNVYLLSEKTGLIYDFSKAQKIIGLEAIFFGGESALYVKPDLTFGKSQKEPVTFRDDEDSNYYQISEENDTLTISKSFSYRAFDSVMYSSNIDSYGNFLLNSGSIISTSGEMMPADSFFSKNANFEYDPVLDKIYTNIDDVGYYLNEKTQPVMAQGKFGCLTDDDGDIGKMFSTYKDMYLISSNENDYYYLNSYMGMVFDIKYLSDYSYTVTKISNIQGTDQNQFVRANDKIYYIRDNNVYSYDPIENKENKLVVNGYQISSISYDNYGNVIVKGYDSFLKSFIGYLKDDDTISLEPVTTDGYLVYSLKPINA